ncbi:MAG: TIGR00303 family protein [Nitrososphaera sp.]
MTIAGLRDIRLVGGSKRTAERFLSANNPFFTCVVSHTATAEIPGLTVAGANPEMVRYTSPADAEFLHYGHCKCIPVVPATPDGKPTPALITRAALRAAGIPFLVADAGAKVRPAVPAVSMGAACRPGGNIAIEDAMDEKDVETALAYGRAFGRQLAAASDLVVIGESIPGGTTTALAVLCALGIDARFKVSSSMPHNPHELKNKVVDAALKRAKPGTPAQCVACFGDPMMPAARKLVLPGDVVLARQRRAEGQCSRGAPRWRPCLQ